MRTEGKFQTKSIKKRYILAASLLAILLMSEVARVSLSEPIQAEIEYFYVDKSVADVEEEITFHWKIKGTSGTLDLRIKFGDGTIKKISGAQAEGKYTYSYNYEGLYNATLYVEESGKDGYLWKSVTDLSGNGIMIDIRNEAPKFDIKFSNNNPLEDEPVKISVDELDDSSNDEKQGVINYIYDFADGSEQITTRNLYVFHVWTTAGIYPVSITAIDDQGAIHQETKNLNVTNGIPNADFTLGAGIPSTYSFSEDISGTAPFGWKFSDNKYAKQAIKVIDEKGNHGKVVKITSNPELSIKDNFIETYVGNQYYGTIEYHFMTSNVNDPIGFFSLKTKEREALSIFVDDGIWKYRLDGSHYNIYNLDYTENPKNNIWHHIRIDFCVNQSKIKKGDSVNGLGNNQFRVSIDGRDFVYHEFNTENNPITYIRIGSYMETNGDAYIDSIGLSWDENYKVGDNFNVFKSSYYGTFDWRGNTIGTSPDGWEIHDYRGESNYKEIYLEDFSNNESYWDLYDITDRTIEMSSSLSDDSYVRRIFPDNNYGDETGIKISEKTETCIDQIYILKGREPSGSIQNTYYYDQSFYSVRSQPHFSEMGGIIVNMQQVQLKFDHEFDYDPMVKYNFKVDLKFAPNHYQTACFASIVEYHGGYIGIPGSTPPGMFSEPLFSSQVIGTGWIHGEFTVDGLQGKNLALITSSLSTGSITDFELLRWRAEYRVYLDRFMAISHENEAFVKREIPYLTNNYTKESELNLYLSENIDETEIKIFQTNDFSEDSLTWNTRPESNYLHNLSIIGNGFQQINLGAPYSCYKIFAHSQAGGGDYINFYSSQYPDISKRPLIKHYLSKNYQGAGQLYCQTDENERLTLRSPNNINFRLQPGDKIEIKFNTTNQNPIFFNLLDSGIIKRSYPLINNGNFDFNSRIVSFTINEELSMNQMEFTGIFEENKNFIVDYVKIYENLDSEISIVDVGDDYNEVVRLLDKSNENEVWMDNFFDKQENGTIEFWIKSSNTTVETWAFSLYQGSDKIFKLLMKDKKWSYIIDDGSFVDLNNFEIPLDNKWYHLRINFDKSKKEINGIINGDDTFSIKTLDFNGINKIRFGSEKSAEGIAWIDSIGYSWDEFYEIGDNKISMVTYPEKTNIQFNGAESYDTISDRDYLKYYWDFGDGASDFGKFVSHDFLSSGKYNVTLYCKDDNGAIDTFSQIIRIYNTYPMINLTTKLQEIIINEGDTLVFNSQSYDEITDFSDLMHWWIFNDSNFDLIDLSNFEYGGWIKSHLYTDDYDGKAGVLVQDTEGAYDYDLIDVLVKNEAPLISIYEADILANISFEVKRSSLDKFANFNCNLIVDDLIFTSKNLDFNNSEGFTRLTEKELVAMSLSKNWKIMINSTKLPENSWFEIYITIEFLDGEKIILNTGKFFGGNSISWSIDLDPLFVDTKNYTFKHPITLSSEIWDPSIDDINLDISFEVQMIIEVDCSNETFSSYSLILQQELNQANYTIELFKQENRKFVSIQATQSILSKFYTNNEFPTQIDFSFNIFPIIDLNRILIKELNLVNLTFFDYLEVENYIIANVADDDGGNSQLIIQFDSYYGINFENLSPGLETNVRENTSLAKEVIFYSNVYNFDQIVSKNEFNSAIFQGDYVPIIPDDFTIINGTIENFDGDLYFNDDNYIIISAEGAASLSPVFIDNFNDGIRDLNWTDDRNFGCIEEKNGALNLKACWLSYWGDLWCWTIAWAPYCKVPLSLCTEDEWVVSVNVSEAFDYPRRHHYGLMLYQDDENVWLFGPKSGGYIQIDKIIDGELSYVSSVISTDQYLRISKLNNIYYFDFSSDEKTWINLYNSSSIEIDLLDVGVFHKAWLTWSKWISFDNFSLKEMSDSAFVLNITSRLHIDPLDNNYNLENINLLADYKTDSDQLVNISIYNFNTKSWTLIDSRIIGIDNYYLNYPLLTTDYLDDSNDLLIRFEAVNESTKFQLYLDQLRLEYSLKQKMIYGPLENTEIPEFSHEIKINEGVLQSIGNLEFQDEDYATLINSLDNNIDIETIFYLSGASLYDSIETVLLFSFRTNISTTVEIYLYNYISEQWELIELLINTQEFKIISYLIENPEYLGQFCDLKVRFFLCNSSDFQFDLDLLKVNYLLLKGDYKTEQNEYWGEYTPNELSTDIFINSGILDIEGDLEYKDEDYYCFNSTKEGFNTLDIICAFLIEGPQFGDAFDYVNLALSLATNICQLITLSLFNYTSQQWIPIDSIIQCELMSSFYSLPTNFEDFYDSNILLIKINGLNETIQFQLLIDQLKLEYKYTPHHLLSTKIRNVWGVYGNSSQIHDFEHIYYFSDKYDFLYAANYSYLYEGDYLITITADNGFSSIKRGEIISVFNENSFVRIGQFPNVTLENRIVQFSADMLSFGPFENDSRFIWDFGDGYYAYEQNPIHSWSTSGIYNITLMVMDCFGHKYNAVEQITVKEQPPEILGPYSFYGIQGQAVVLDIQIYDSIKDEMNLKYEWYSTTSDLADQFRLISTDKKPIVILDTGNYTFCVCVKDLEGNTAYENITIFIEDLAPIASASNYMYLGNGQKGSNLIEIKAYVYDSFLEDEFTYTWTITNELGNKDHIIHRNRGRMDALDLECKNTTIYLGEVKITDNYGKSSITTFTINSYIDSNGNLFSDEYEAELARNNLELDLYTDTDKDGIVDLLEDAYNLNKTVPDIDEDGLLDGYSDITGIGEKTYGTDPKDPDSDDDLLEDGFEVFGWNITVDNIVINVSSNPVRSDTDADGLDDYGEYLLRVDPRNPDTDNDGLMDNIDPYPLNYDYDEDGLNDYEEIKIGTELNNTDTDGDSLTDGYEVKAGHFITNPLTQDTDHDFVSDDSEHTIYTVESKYLTNGKYIGEKRVELKEEVYLQFEEPFVNASTAQLSFTIAFGEFGSDDSQEYGIEQIPDLEIRIKKDNLILFNGTTNFTRYYSKVIDIKNIIENSNNPSYYGKYVIMTNNTEAKCLLEDFKLEISKLLDPTDDDFDGDGIMDGVEPQLLVRGWNDIDLMDYYAYNNLTLYNSTETYAYNEFKLEIPSIGRVYDSNIHIELQSEGYLKSFGTISLKLMKEEVNCSINNVILVDYLHNFYENDKYSYSLDIDLSDFLDNKIITEYYGNYYLRIEIYEFGDNFDNFSLTEFYIETDTWIQADINDYDAWITDPSKWSTDKDGLSDKQEIDRGLNPQSEDTDGDGFWDHVDRDPFHNIILEVYFDEGEKDLTSGFWDSELKAGFKMDHQGEEIKIWTPNSDDGDFGQKYYIDVDDGRSSVEFTFELFEMRHIEVRKIIKEIKIKTKIKILDDILGWITKKVNRYIQKIFDVHVEIPDRRLERWNKLFSVGDSISYNLRGDKGDLDVKVKSIRLSRSNGIVIYEINSSFNGHYETQERMNVIQLEVINENDSTPFDKGLNTIVIPTNLFIKTLLNSRIQTQQLNSTPLQGCEFSSTERDDEKTKNISNENIDFIIIKAGLNQTQAMDVLNLLTMCIINDTSGEIAKRYSAYSTKLNNTKIEQMNVNADVLKLIPFIGGFQNSEQGEAPAGLWKTILQNIETMKKIYENIISSIKETFEETVKKIKNAIDKIAMTVLTFLKDLIMLLIKAALLILIWAIFVLTLALVAGIFLMFIPMFEFLSEMIEGKSTIKSDSLKIQKNSACAIMAYKTGSKYIKLLDLEIPTIFFTFETDKSYFKTNINYLDTIIEVPYELFELMTASETKGLENSSKKNSNNPENGLVPNDFMMGLLTYLASLTVGIAFDIFALTDPSKLDVAIIVATGIAYIVSLEVLFKTILEGDIRGSRFFGGALAGSILAMLLMPILFIFDKPYKEIKYITNFAKVLNLLVKIGKIIANIAKLLDLYDFGDGVISEIIRSLAVPGFILACYATKKIPKVDSRDRTRLKWQLLNLGFMHIFVAMWLIFIVIEDDQPV